jgi:hypothetical protein
VVVGGGATVKVTVLAGVLTVSVTGGPVVVTVTGTVSVAAGSVEITELRLPACPEHTKHAANTNTNTDETTATRTTRRRRTLPRSLPCPTIFPPPSDDYTRPTEHA